MYAFSTGVKISDRIINLASSVIMQRTATSLGPAGGRTRVGQNNASMLSRYQHLTWSNHKMACRNVLSGIATRGGVHLRALPAATKKPHTLPEEVVFPYNR